MRQPKTFTFVPPGCLQVNSNSWNLTIFSPVLDCWLTTSPAVSVEPAIDETALRTRRPPQTVTDRFVHLVTVNGRFAPCIQDHHATQQPGRPGLHRHEFISANFKFYGNINQSCLSAASGMHALYKMLLELQSTDAAHQNRDGGTQQI